MRRQSLQWFLDNDCMLREPDVVVLVGIYQMSNGDPCDGCAMHEECPAYPKLKAMPAVGDRPSSVQPARETNAQAAVRLGVSKRQVAKMRQRGELP